MYYRFEIQCNYHSHQFRIIISSMQTQNIGKRYALQRGHRQYKEALQKKYRQQNSPIFKQIHNLLPEHFQNLQQEIRCLGCIQELEKAESLNLSQAQRSFTLMIDHIGMRGGQNSSFDSKYSELIEQSLCALLNNSRGYLLVGVSPNKGTVCGVQISDREKSSFVQNVRKVLSKFIMPKEELEPLLRDSQEFDKVFQIRFIPVVERQSSNDETDLYVIRIRVETTQIIRQDKVFYINVPKLGSDNTEQVSIFYIGQGKVERVENQQTSEFIGKRKRMFSKKTMETNILIDPHKCRESSGIETNINEKAKRSNEQDQKLKKYSHESILIVDYNDTESVQKFNNMLDSKKIKYLHYEINKWQNFQKKKKCFYYNHQNRHDKLVKLKQENMKDSCIYISRVVGKQLMIKDYTFGLEMAYITDLLGKNLDSMYSSYGYKRDYCPIKRRQYQQFDLVFESREKAVNAFLILQQRGIITEFFKNNQ